MKILFTSWDGTGNVPPTIALARQLASQGHDVRFLGHASLAARSHEAGLRFIPHERLPDLYQRDDFGDSEDPWWNDVFFNPISGDDVRAELEREPADVVVVDCLLWGDAAAAEAAGVPTVIFVHTLYGRFIGDNSGEGFLERVSALNATRRRWGLPDVEEPRRAWDTATAVLVASASVLDLPSPPKNVVYAGPLRDDGEPSPVTVDTSANGGIVVISFSTSRAVTPRLAQRTLDALADLPVRGLLLTGEHLDPSILTVPSNVDVATYVPHSKVMPQADLVVTHAGHGTVMAALLDGVPVLCLPMIADQPFVARRVEECGVGRSLSPRADVSALREAILDLLDTPRYRTRARELARAVRGELDLEQAATTVVAAAK